MLEIRRPGLDPRPCNVEFAIEPIFFEYIGFPYQFSFHLNYPIIGRCLVSILTSLYNLLQIKLDAYPVTSSRKSGINRAD